MKRNAIDYAMYFIKRGLDDERNTFDGNMKLQKLLFFANFISLINNNEELFDENIRAFSYGCVVEEVRLRYKNDYDLLYKDSKEFNPEFNQKQYDILNLTIDIFGDLKAKELSDINHNFKFWENAYERSKGTNGYKNKSDAVITKEEMMSEKNKMQEVVNCFLATKDQRACKETINGITFYYSSNDIKMTDDIIEQLIQYSLTADDNSYSIYMDNNELVVY